MKQQGFTIIEKRSSLPTGQILIVDKEGYIGQLLCNSLSDNATVVFLTQQPPHVPKRQNNIHYVPYARKVPSVPKAAYSYIFVVHNGEKAVEEVAGAICQEAKRQRATFVLVVQKDTASKDTLSLFAPFGSDVRVAIVGEIFGVLKSPFGAVDMLLLRAKNHGRVVLPNTGLTKTFPVFYEDAVRGMLHAAFAQQAKKPFFHIYPQHAITQLSIVRMLKKIDPFLGIDFAPQSVRQDTQEPTVPLPEGEFVLGGRYPLQDRLKKAWEKAEAIGTQLPCEATKIKKKQRVHVAPRSLLRATTLLFFAIFALPLFGIVACSLGGAYELKSAQQSLKRGDMQRAYNQTIMGKRLFNAANRISPLIVWQGSLLGKKEDMQKLAAAVKAGEDASYIGESLLFFANATRAVLQGSAPKPQETFSQAVASLKDAIITTQNVQTQWQGALVANQLIPSSFASAIADKKIASSLRVASSVLPTLPTIVGFHGAKQYLILFQNNMELRGGGGFIGSYALLTLDKGKVQRFTIHDVYDADGQLKGHVEPPFAIRRFLPSVHWYLRDSNFSPDFTKAASSAAFLLAAETGEKVDGVIGVDVSFVEKLLRATGPIFVSDYNETVTAENLYVLTQEHAEKDFFPGSTQKKDFLRSLALATLFYITEEKGVSYVKLAYAIQEGISQKHVLFAFSEKSMQDVFAANGLSSSLAVYREEESDTFTDFLGISEANLGVNKVNVLIQRKVSYAVSVDAAGNTSSELTIKYANASKKRSLYEGDYKNYLRLILPKGTILYSITINGESQAMIPAITDPLVYEKERFVPPSGLEVYQEEEGMPAGMQGKTVVGFLTIVPLNSVQTITVSYTHAASFPIRKPASLYKLVVFKQPGTDVYPFDFSFAYPQGVTVREKPKDAKSRERSITLGSNLASDREIRIAFSSP